MPSLVFLSLLTVVLCAGWGQIYQNLSIIGFSSHAFMASVGGQAACIAGYVTVNVTASQTKLLYTGPADNMAATQFIIDLQQVNPGIYNRTNGGISRNTNSTFNIYSKLCVPTKLLLLKNLTTVQFLTHGATLDMNYWEIAKDYSYIDAAAAKGYATFSYDRLGVGKSDQPEPIQVVQAPIQVEIAHSLVQLLRSGMLGGFRFYNVVGVGHSAGSTFTQAVTTKYPADFNATILQGFSTQSAYLGATHAALGLVVASSDPSNRFEALPNGYLVPGDSQQSFQLPYFHYSGFDPKILQLEYSIKQTLTVGELLTLRQLHTASRNYTGPVDILLGQYDFPACGGDCTYPKDQAAAVQPAPFPASQGKSRNFLVPNSSHNINAHYTANLAFAHMMEFLSDNGIH